MLPGGTQMDESARQQTADALHRYLRYRLPFQIVARGVSVLGKKANGSCRRSETLPGFGDAQPLDNSDEGSKEHNYSVMIAHHNLLDLAGNLGPGF